MTGPRRCSKRFCKRGRSASDLTHDAMERVVQRFADFRGDTEAEWRAWCLTILENAIASDSGTPHVSQCVTASGYTHCRYRHDPVRHMSVNNPSGPGMAHGRPASAAPTVSRRCLPG